MSKASYFLLMALSIAIMVGCKKGDDAAAINPTSVKEFQTCDCQTDVKGLSSEYIKADIDGVSVCFDVNPVFNDTFPNMLKYGSILRSPDHYYDNVIMIRNARNSPWQAAIFLENTHALTKEYPYYLPRANPEYCEIGELQLNNLNHYVGCYFCPENRFNYLGLIDSSGIKMMVSSFKDGFFEGSFEGMAYRSGEKVTIKNGQFRIKLVVYQSDITN